MTRQLNPHPLAMWCDHCRADIAPAGVRGCLRTDCQSKHKLREREQCAPYVTTAA
jgi:hypothetical protein